MRQQIRDCLTYYQQFHHSLVNWHITISGFIFAALLAADVSDIKTDQYVVGIIYFAVLAFPLIFIAAISQYGKRIERLNTYLAGSDDDIPDKWYDIHKGFGISLSGAGSWYFFCIIAMQAAVNFFLAFTRLR